MNKFFSILQFRLKIYVYGMLRLFLGFSFKVLLLCWHTFCLNLHILCSIFFCVFFRCCFGLIVCCVPVCLFNVYLFTYACWCYAHFRSVFVYTFLWYISWPVVTLIFGFLGNVLFLPIEKGYRFGANITKANFLFLVMFFPLFQVAIRF